MNIFEEIKKIRQNFIRSAKDIASNYQTNKYYPRNQYYKNIEQTSSKRIDTFQNLDRYVNNLLPEQRIELYSKMYDSSGWVQRGLGALVYHCLNTYPLTDVLYNEEKFDKDLVYQKKVADINRLMEDPCIEMDKRALFTLTFLELIAFGNSYWQKLWNMSRTQILSFVKLRPETITIVPKLDKRTGLYHYYYLQKLGEDSNGLAQYKIFTEDDIIKFHIPNLTNPLYGKSHLQGLTYIVYMDVQAQIYQSKFFKYGITPGTIINLEEVNSEDIDYFNNLLSQRYSNQKEPFSVMLLPGKSKVINDKSTMADLDLRGLRNANSHEILNILGVPPLMLSMDKLQIQRQDTSYDNFINDTISPLQKIFYDTLNRQLIKRHYDESDIVVSKGSQIVPGTKDAADFVKIVMQLVPMTANEVRELTGITLLEKGGDEFFIYTPNGVVPYNYHFNVIDEGLPERTYELDEGGKVIDPKKMISKVDMKLGQKIRRSVDLSLKEAGRINSKQYLETQKKLKEITFKREQEIQKEREKLDISLNKLKEINNKINKTNKVQL